MRPEETGGGGKRGRPVLSRSSLTWSVGASSLRNTLRATRTKDSRDLAGFQGTKRWTGSQAIGGA